MLLYVMAENNVLPETDTSDLKFATPVWVREAL